MSELTRLIAGAERGVILAGRQPDAELARPVAALAAACGYPVLAEPTSQLRAGTHDRGTVVAHYDSIFRKLPDRLAPELVLRVGDMVTSKAVRTWLSSNRGCRQLVVDPDGAWNEPTGERRPDRAGRPRSAVRLVRRRARAARRRTWLDAWLAADRAASERSTPSSTVSATSRSSRACTARSARCSRR